MLFNSPAFIFVFLPAVFFLYRLMPSMRGRNVFLAAAGLLFYAFGQLRSLPVLLASVLVNYAAGLLIKKISASPSMKEQRSGSPAGNGTSVDCQSGTVSETRQKVPRCVHRSGGNCIVMSAAVALNIIILVFYKYAGFALPEITLPLGISFFTFQGISYVVDVYHDPDTASRDFMDVLLYISFFPRLISGPLVRYKDARAALTQRQTCPEKDLYGLKRFITGLSKKVLISAAAAEIADSVFAEVSLSGTSAALSCIDFRLAWLGALCYMLQIYFDFSGYSDMAIGISALFGFSTSENFNLPYAAISIRDFWRRWHISLSSWFRDYLYIPLGGSRKGKKRAALNRMAVFLCTGIWHGANLTFLVWGFCHGVLSAMEGAGMIPVEKLKKTVPGRLLCRAYVLLSVMLLFVVFRADSLFQAWSFIRSMFAFIVTDGASLQLARLLTPAAVFVLILGILFSGPVAEKLKTSPRVSSFALRTPLVLKAFVYFLLFLISLMSISKGGFAPFIYFQF